MKKVVCLCVAVVFLMTVGLVWAQEKRSSAAQARMWVEKADKYIKENGVKASIAEFNKPSGPFIKDDLYITVIDFNGVMKAMPIKREMVGVNRSSIKDPDGKFFIKEMANVAKTKGSGWVDYKYVHPKTKKTEQKTTFVKRIAGTDMYLACGAYK